jgi:hypothetical protein
MLLRTDALPGPAPCRRLSGIPTSHAPRRPERRVARRPEYEVGEGPGEGDPGEEPEEGEGRVRGGW